MAKKSIIAAAAAPVAQVARELPPEQQVPRLDICVIFDAQNCNPNGDPDRGNAPRRNPTNGHGMTSDVSIKRKLRDRVEDRFAGEPGLSIFVTRGAVLSDIKKRVMADKADPTLAMCEEFWDIRCFGAVLAANQDAAARATNVRGPVQVSMAESVEPVIVSEPAITRCAAENEREKDGVKRLNQTFGSKQLVHYGLYRAHVFVDPIRAKKTGFSMDDLEILKDALSNMFEGDRASGRTGLCVRAIYAFEHKSPLGTPGANGLELLEQIHIERISEGPGQRFEDYRISLPGGLPEGLTLSTWKEPLVLPRLEAAE